MSGTRLKYFLIFVLICIGIFSVEIVYLDYWQQRFGAPDNPGVAGDMFGALTSLFTGLAFAGLIVTMLMQNEDLALHRKELEDTRRVLQDQQEQMSKQTEYIERQTFENTFFRMLESFRLARNDVRDETYSGLDAIDHFKAEVVQLVEQEIEKSGDDDDVRVWVRIYEDAYRETDFFLGPYFRSLFQLLRFTSNQSMDELTKKKYVDLVRSKLLPSELGILALMGLSKYAVNARGEPELKIYMDRYNLLKHFSEKRSESFRPILKYYQIRDASWIG